MNNIILDKDINDNIILDKRIAVIGYGNQGRAQALNLKDSGLNVKIGLRSKSDSIGKVKSDKLEYLSIEKAVKWANLICILLPDKIAPNVYKKYINNYLKDGDTLLFSHGYNIHYKLISPPLFVNVVMVAPSGGGFIVRQEYKKDSGVPSLVAVDKDKTGNALEIAKSYAKAIGSGRICIFESTFKEETETDIFGEQAILTGGLPFLISSAYNTLINNGYDSTVAWFVCYYEIKTIVDLFHDNGFDQFYKMISDTARIGGISSGRKLIDESFSSKLDLLLQDIKDGSFYKSLKNAKDETLPVDFDGIEKQTKKILKIIKK